MDPWELLEGIWQLDNKPHKLFAALERYVRKYNDGTVYDTAELLRLLDNARKNARLLNHPEEA